MTTTTEKLMNKMVEILPREMVWMIADAKAEQIQKKADLSEQSWSKMSNYEQAYEADTWLKFNPMNIPDM